MAGIYSLRKDLARGLPGRAGPRPWAWRLAGAAASAAGLLWGWGTFGGETPPGAAAGWVVAGVVALWAGERAARQRRLWAEPLRKLEQLAAEACDGHVAMEDLAEIQGPLSVLSLRVQALARELHRQRVEVAEMERETRQRIANRTNALERKIGSLRRQATRDVLTGLYNRRMLEEHLPPTLRRCKAEGISLCLLMIDVDNFKPLNDTLGHAAGDELLRTIGRLIRSAIRETDLAFRCGGDEFVVLLERCDADAGHAFADRLAALVDDLARTLRVPRRPRLSIGAATLADCPDASPQALLDLADKHLYQVKGSRRS